MLCIFLGNSLQTSLLKTEQLLEIFCNFASSRDRVLW